MSPITPNPDEVEELEGQLLHALKREAGPASLAPNVEARMNGGHASSRMPPTAAGGTPKTAPVAMPDVTSDGVPHVTQNVGPVGVPHISPGILPNTAEGHIPNTAQGGTPQFVRMPRSEEEPHLWN